MAISIGLDIGSKNLRVIELEDKNNQKQIRAYGSMPSPLDGPVFANNEEKAALSASIKRLFKEAEISRAPVNIALSESQTFTQVIETPLLSEKELGSAMQWQADQYIPLPLEEVRFDFEIMEKNKELDKMRILLTGAPTKLINKYVELMQNCDLKIKNLETQIISLVRIFSRLIPENKVGAVVDFGYKSTDFAFVLEKNVLFTRSIPSGGSALTKAISREFDFTVEQAEQYKRTYGIDRKQLEGKIYNTVKPLLDQFLSELNKGFIYFKESYPKRSVDLILITGGGSLMPGIVSFMTESFAIETQIGEPLTGINVNSQLISPPHNGIGFSTALGLAMRK